MLKSRMHLHRYGLYSAISELVSHPISTLMETLLIAILWLIMVTSMQVVQQIEPLKPLLSADKSLLVVMPVQAGEQQADSLASNVRSWSNVNDVQVVSPRQGMRDIGQALGLSKHPDWLKTEMLPYVVRLQVPATLSDLTYKAIQQSLENLPGVQSVSSDEFRDQAWSDMVFMLKQSLQGLMIGVVFVTVVIIFNLVERWGMRLQADIKRFYLLGADDHFAYRTLTYMALAENLVAVSVAYLVSQWMHHQYQPAYHRFINHWLGADILPYQLGWGLLVWLVLAALITVLVCWLGRHFRSLFYYRLLR